MHGWGSTWALDAAFSGNTSSRGQVVAVTATYVQVLVAHGNTVTLVDADAATDQELQHGPIRRLAVAPNGQFLAAFTDEGKLIVWTADFGKFLSEFATQSDSPPEQLAWCGTDSVVLFWEVRPLHTIASSSVKGMFSG